MPKIVTAQHRAGEAERARLYVKSRLMMPTIPLGMVALLTGYGGVVVAWLQEKLTPEGFFSSSILFVAGAAWGWVHAQYDRYLLNRYPEYLARKQKVLDAVKGHKKRTREVSISGLNHPGRKLVLVGYIVGLASQFGLTVYFIGEVGVYAAVFLPWAGYFNAKVIALRDLLVG